MRGNPELACIASEETRLRRAEQRDSSSYIGLRTALDAYVAEYGPGDGAAFCCKQATRLTLIANPRSTRETREAAERAFAQMVAE